MCFLGLTHPLVMLLYLSVNALCDPFLQGELSPIFTITMSKGLLLDLCTADNQCLHSVDVKTYNELPAISSRYTLR